MKVIVKYTVNGRKYRGVPTLKNVYTTVTIGDGTMIHKDLDTVKTIYTTTAKNKGGDLVGIYKADNLV